MQPSEIIYALRPHMSLPVVLTRGKKKFVAWKQTILQKHRISYICGQRELAAEKKMHRKKSVGFWAISAAHQQFYQCVVSAGEEHAVLGIAPSSSIHSSDPVTLSVPNVRFDKELFRTVEEHICRNEGRITLWNTQLHSGKWILFFSKCEEVLAAICAIWRKNDCRFPVRWETGTLWEESVESNALVKLSGEVTDMSGLWSIRIK